MLVALALVIPLILPGETKATNWWKTTPRIWLNHLKLLPGDASVQVSYEANADPYGGVPGLMITSSSPGNRGPGGGDKVVWMAVHSQPGYRTITYPISSVSISYQVYNTTTAPTSIDLVRVTQVQNPPGQEVVVMNEAANLTDPGPACVKIEARPRIDTKPGPLYLRLRLNFASPNDVIVIRGIRLILDVN